MVLTDIFSHLRFLSYYLKYPFIKFIVSLNFTANLVKSFLDISFSLLNESNCVGDNKDKPISSLLLFVNIFSIFYIIVSILDEYLIK